jgi:hypothetical protein
LKNLKVSWRVAQVAGRLPSNCKALSSNPGTKKEREREREKKERSKEGREGGRKKNNYKSIILHFENLYEVWLKREMDSHTCCARSFEEYHGASKTVHSWKNKTGKARTHLSSAMKIVLTSKTPA